MKKLTVIIASLIALCSLSACSVNTYEEGYAEGYDSGYFDGSDQGYWDGFEDGYDDGIVWGYVECQEDVASEVISKYEDIVYETSCVYGLHPEEAVLTLVDYMNGEHISKEDLNAAIDAICQFYYRSENLVFNIAEMDVEFDLD